MTSNTDAPERIWAHPPTTFDEMDVWQEAQVDGATEYIRADLATRQQAEAVGAAYEAAKNAVAHRCVEANKPVIGLKIERDIYALTPSDATAALEACDARVWDAAIEAAAEIMDRRAKGCWTMVGADAGGQCEGGAEDIRALKKGTSDA